MINAKLIKINVSLLVLLSIAATSSAQSGSKNVAKVNLSAFTFKGYGLQYERQISKRFTAAIGYGAIPYGTIAYQSVIESYTEDVDAEIGKFKLGTSIITPEIRYYVGRKGAFHGFYLAPYARISSYKMQVPVSFGSATSERTALFDGKINNTTGGLMIGSQFKLSKLLYLDWWILGASIGSAKGNLVATTPLNPLEQQELRNQINNIEIPFTEIRSDVNSTGATITTTGSIAGARGLGINLGFRF